MSSIFEIENLLLSAEQRLLNLENEKQKLLNEIKSLKQEKEDYQQHLLLIPFTDNTTIQNNSPPKDKIALFRSLFRGREDVFPKRFESQKTGKSGYQPVCKNEWVRSVCNKPKIKCMECEHCEFVSISDDWL